MPFFIWTRDVDFTQVQITLVTKKMLGYRWLVKDRIEVDTSGLMSVMKTTEEKHPHVL